MQCKDVFKLIPVEAAMLILAFTLIRISEEDKELVQIIQPMAERFEIIEEPAEAISESEIIPASDSEEEIADTEPIINLDPEDEEILLKIAMSEAGGESTQGKALVILTVLNRVSSDEFPNTIPEVVFQERQYSPVLDGRYATAIPDNDCYAALELVKNGWDESQGAMYFENYGADCWHSRNLEFLYQEGNHRFYK